MELVKLEMQEQVEKAREILLAEYAMISDIAWAWEILCNRSYSHDEERYRYIHDKIQSIESFGLPTRYYDGLPFSGGKGIPVVGSDARKTQYLRVLDVVTGIKSAKLDNGVFDSLEIVRKKGRPSLLTEKQKAEIKELHANNPNLTSEAIGKIYGVSHSLVKKEWN